MQVVANRRLLDLRVVRRNQNQDAVAACCSAHERCAANDLYRCRVRNISP